MARIWWWWCGCGCGARCGADVVLDVVCVWMMMMVMIIFFCDSDIVGENSETVAKGREVPVFGTVPGVFLRIPHPKLHTLSEALRHLLCFVFAFFFA